MVETILTLCRLSGVSGWEDSVREYLIKEAEPYADEMRTDASGNLLIRKQGRKRAKREVMLAAHMDEVGILIKSVTQEGFLRFAFVGGVDQRVIIGKKVYVGENRIPGVIGLKPIHLTSAKERKTIPEVSQMYLDIGANTKEEALRWVRPGDFGVFAPEEIILGGNTVCCKALDDRVGCGILLTMLKEQLPFDTWFAFTVQEEIGCRGAFGAAFGLQPELAFIVEGTTAADAPPASGSEKVCIPGNGPVLPFADGATMYDRSLLQFLQKVAREEGIPWQTKMRIAGGTDARAIQRAGKGCKVAAVSAAIRYLHSPSSVGNIRDWELIKQLLSKALEKLEEQDEI
jgi:putative aminopeptidase FrvX